MTAIPSSTTTTTTASGTGPGRFAPEPPGRRRSRLPAVGAALALLALVVGVPALLLLLQGPPALPDHWPDRSAPVLRSARPPRGVQSWVSFC